MTTMDGRRYELMLLHAARESISSIAQLSANQRIGGTPIWEIDALCIPHSGPNADIPHVIEFKYSHSRTLPTAVVLQILGKFQQLEAANSNMGIRFALVTNAHFRPALVGRKLPGNVLVWDQVASADTFVERLRKWLMDAPPRATTESSRDPFVEGMPFPWADGRAKDLLLLLVSFYRREDDAEHVGKRAGIYLGYFIRGRGAEPAWKSLLEAAATQGKLRTLFDTILDDTSSAGAHDRLIELANLRRS